MCASATARRIRGSGARAGAMSSPLASLNLPRALRRGRQPSRSSGLRPLRGHRALLLTQDMNAVSRFYQVQKDAAGPGSGWSTRRCMSPICRARFWAATRATGTRSWRGTASGRGRGTSRGATQALVRGSSLPPALPAFRSAHPSGMFDRDSRTFPPVGSHGRRRGGLRRAGLSAPLRLGLDPVHGPLRRLRALGLYSAARHNFRKAMAGCRTPERPGLYLEGILVRPAVQSRQGPRRDWQMLVCGGQPTSTSRQLPYLRPCTGVEQYLSTPYRGSSSRPELGLLH